MSQCNQKKTKYGFISSVPKGSVNLFVKLIISPLIILLKHCRPRANGAH